MRLPVTPEHEPHLAGPGVSTWRIGRQSSDVEGTACPEPCIPGWALLTPGWAPGHWVGLSLPIFVMEELPGRRLCYSFKAFKIPKWSPHCS